MADRMGRPLFFDTAGQINPDNIWKVTTEERFFQFMYADYERLLKRRCLAMSHITQTQINEITCIFDLKGFGLTKMSKKIRALLGASLSLSSNNYPESMAMTLIINTPTSFKTIWGFIKGFLDEKQRKKIIMVGSKY